MDHKPEHLQDPALILKDLRASRSALELFLKAGKAREMTVAELMNRGALEINGSNISRGVVCDLIFEARRAREYSYAPYSHFNVGAAILAEDRHKLQRIFGGCNVENAGYNPTNCGERTAAFKAVSDGFRTFHAYAVCGGFDYSMPADLREAVKDDYITPCGPCRQVTNEFDANPCMVIVVTDTDKVLVSTLEFLLPAGFGPKSLGVNASSYDRHNR